MVDDENEFMSADEYGKSLRGIGFNLLVQDMARALEFQRSVLLADVLHANDDFAALSIGSNDYQLHADRTYNNHPMSGIVANSDTGRGIGVELRLYGVDPDEATARAYAKNFVVLAEAMDKPHGLREAYLIDDEGYVWVPSVALAQAT